MVPRVFQGLSRRFHRSYRLITNCACRLDDVHSFFFYLTHLLIKYEKCSFFHSSISCVCLGESEKKEKAAFACGSGLTRTCGVQGLKQEFTWIRVEHPEGF